MGEILALSPPLSPLSLSLSLSHCFHSSPSTPTQFAYPRHFVVLCPEIVDEVPIFVASLPYLASFPLLHRSCCLDDQCSPQAVEEREKAGARGNHRDARRQTGFQMTTFRSG